MISKQFTPDQWLETYAQAWGEKNLELSARLWSSDVVYSFDPFSLPLQGRDAVVAYWKSALEGQSDIALQTRLWAVREDQAAAEWWVSFERGGQPFTLNASLLLRFDSEGRCCELREHWLQSEGRVAPPERFKT